jgi:hypothetical protein
VDFPEAYVWFSLAARRAIPNAAELCEALRKEMTPDQVEEGQHRLNRRLPAQPKVAEEKVEVEGEVNVKFPNN